MELASMLAGEPFTDHPKSVCPVIGSFLRAYNDSVDDRRRQDLYAYASKVVGSSANAEVEAARARRVAEWTAGIETRWWRRVLPPVIQTFSMVDSIGVQAVRAVRRSGGDWHAKALALLDELLKIGPAEGSARQQPTSARVAHESCPASELITRDVMQAYRYFMH
jgi:hypothetical protein